MQKYKREEPCLEDAKTSRTADNCYLGVAKKR